MVSWDTANSTHYEPTHFLSAFASFAKIIRYQQLPASSTAEQRHHLLSLGQAKKKPPKTWVHDPKLNGSPIRTSQTQVAKHIYGICYIKYGYKYICVTICVCIYIYPQTGTFADPETHPLRAFVPFLPGRVLAFGLFFFAFFVASRASVHTWHGHIPKPNVTRVQSATQWTASVHTLHMPKPNVTRVQSATEWTASVHTLHMSKPNLTRVQSATEWTASVHTLHMPKPNVTRVQSATEWTASVHTLHMPKPNVTRVQSATEWTASVHTLHMSKPNLTRVQSATEWTASVHTLHMPKPNVTRVQSATEWTASVHTLHMPKPNVTRVQSATEWTASVHTLHMSKPVMYNPCSKCYAMDCFGTYFTHAQT